MKKSELKKFVVEIGKDLGIQLEVDDYPNGGGMRIIDANDHGKTPFGRERRRPKDFYHFISGIRAGVVNQ